MTTKKKVGHAGLYLRGLQQDIWGILRRFFQAGWRYRQLSSLISLFVVVALVCGLAGRPAVAAQSVSLSYNPTPYSQLAATDDVWSLYRNPAGLAFLGGLQFVGGYQHEWLPQQLSLHHADAGFGFNLFRRFTLATAGKMAVPGSGELGLGLVVGSAFRFHDSIALGLSILKRRLANSDTEPVHLALGLQSRVTRWLALGTSIWQVNPSWGDPFALAVGASFRPWREYITLGTDLHWLPRSEQWRDGLAMNPQVGLQLHWSGLTLHTAVQLQDVVRGLRAPWITASLQLNSPYLGAGLSGGGQPQTGISQAYAGALVRLSTERWQGFARKKQWVSVSLNPSGGLQTAAARSLWQRLFRKTQHPLQVLAALRSLANNKAIDGVLINMPNLRMGFGGASQLRNVILSLRQAGKKVVIYLERASTRTYYVASAASAVYLAPAGVLQINGFRSTLLHVAGLLDKIGIKAQVVRSGRYKSAGQILAGYKPTAEEIEVANAILDERYNAFVQAVSSQRPGKDEQTVKQLIDQGGLVASEALQHGLVDGLATWQQMQGVLRQSFALRQPPQSNFLTAARKQLAWRAPSSIAVVVIKGSIVPGRVKPALVGFGGNKVGADDVIDMLQHAANRRRVKAVVLYIDSPGGDAVASDLIYQAARSLAQVKPVVAVMGDVAASGGYYAAAAAQYIYAQPTTITGSIGVLNVLISAKPLADKLKISTVEIARGKLPGPSLFRSATSQELQRYQQLIDWYARKFEEAVQHSRNLTKQQVHTLAQGRAWTGKQALQHGLIDALGGLPHAIAKARQLANVSPNTPLSMSIWVPGSTPTLRLPNLWSQAIQLPAAQQLLQQAKLLQELCNSPLAILPFMLHDNDATASSHTP
ncbi:MAG: signal peptide peptidase SppA [Myxococcota bacterium]